MFVLVENDSITKTLNTSRGITIGENQYPRAIYTLFSSSEREAVGIYEVVQDNSNKKDEDYYINTDQSYNFADGAATASYGSAIAQSLTNTTDEDGNVIPGLKTKKKDTIKQQANSLLASTDWYIIRKADAGTAVPEATVTHRAAIRTASNEMEASIDGASDVDALAALYIYTDGARPLGEFPEEV